MALTTTPPAHHRRRAAILVGAFAIGTALVLALLVWVFLPWWDALIVGLVVAALLAWVCWTRSDRLVLAATRARPVTADDQPRYANLVEGLTASVGLPLPRLYVVEASALNAMAVGGSTRRAALVVTTGLLERLGRVELEGVLAHELAHVRSGEVVPATVAVTTVGAPVFVADLLLRLRYPAGPDDPPRPGLVRVVAGGLASGLLAFAPVSSRLIAWAVGSATEYDADLVAVSVTRYPPGLLAALEKLAAGTTVTRAASRSTAHLWLAAPLPRNGRLAPVNHLFEVQPPLGSRIEALREL